MRHSLVLFAALCSVAGTLWAAEPARPVFKIGIIAPLTGDFANIGQDVREGATLALEEHPTTSVRYQVFYEDSQNQPRLNNTAIQRLTSLNKIDVAISLWSPAANVVAPIAESTQTLHFTIAWDSKIVERYRWTLIYGPSMEGFAARVLEIFKAAGCKRIAVASSVHIGNNRVIAALKPLLKASSMELVFEEQLAPSERDFRVYLMRLAETHPDATLQMFEPPQDEIFNRQARQLQIPLGVTTGYLDYYSPEARQMIDGSIYPSDLWATAEFREKFRARFGHDFVTDAPHAYDLVQILIDTVEDFYAAHTRLPTHEELLALLKTPRELDLAAGKSVMHANGWLETPFMLRRMASGVPVEL